MTRRAGCIISSEGEYLIVHQPSSGFWGFPKGHLNEGELPEICAIREVYEETGVLLAVNCLGHCYRCKDSKFYTVVLTERPKVMIDYHEIDDYMWTTLNNLSSMPTSVVTKQLLEKIRKGPI